MTGSKNLPDVVLLVVILGVILALGIAVINPIIETTTDENGDETQTAVEIGSAGTWYKISDVQGTNPEVVSSRGYAVNLTGASDSYVQSDSSVSIPAGSNWTVSTWGYLDGDASSGEYTLLSVNGRVIISYNSTQSEWRVWYYDDGSTNSYSMSATAPNQPANLTNIQVVSNETHLNLYRNNTLADTVNTTQSNTVAAPNASNWNGRLEEVRVFNESLSNTDRQEIVDNPVAPQPNTDRSARIMFDEPYENTQLILFASGTVEQSNVTFSSGFEGTTLSEGQLAAVDEYQWNEDGPRIKILEGSSAADLPVVYVDYESQALGPATLSDDWGQAVVLAGILPLIVIVGFIITVLRDTR